MAIQFSTKKMSARAKATGAAVGILALPVLAWPSAAHADLTVCNETAKKVNVAYGFINHDGKYESGGWVIVNPLGDCRVAVSTSETDDPHHYFTYAYGGGHEWLGDGSHGNSFCTLPR